MAGSVRFFTKLSLGVLSKSVTRHIVLNQKRTLFSEASLGMTAYQAARNAYKTQFTNLEDSFRSKMKTYVDNEASGMIFTEDLKVMLHLAENTPEDKELMIKMLKKFNSQSAEMRFTTFLFGPIVMRSLHRLNDPDLALELFNDEEFSTFFNQLSSYQIFLDLLYCNKRYEEIIRVYDSIRTRITEEKVHPRNSLILVTAACYKMNTPESWKYGLELWRDLDKRGYPTVRRVLTHLAALAINQGDSHAALEMLVTAKKPRYIAIRCLKIMAFCKIDRLDDVIPFFRATLDEDDPSVKKETYFKDTIDEVEAAIERAKPAPDAEIVKLLNLIKIGGLVQTNTVDDHINEEIIVVPRTFTGTRDDQFDNRNRDQQRDYRSRNDQRDYRNRESSRSEYSQPKVYRRPGLRDLV